MTIQIWNLYEWFQSWVHLEGRNRETILEVLKYLKEKQLVKFSVEVEKVNRNFEDFIPYADIVFISKVVVILKQTIQIQI